MQIKHTFLFTLILGVAWTGYLFALSLGPDPAMNGIFGSTQTCASSGCHQGNPVNALGGTLTLSGLPEGGWTPGQTYELSVTIQRTGAQLFGFQLSAVADATNQQAGTLVQGHNRVKIICGRSTGNTTATVPCTTAGSIQYAEHSNALIRTSTYLVNWTAPSSASTGTVRFNFAGNAANGDANSTGDFIYTGVATVGPASASPPPVTTFYFPQVADGVQDAAVSWKTTIFVTNPAAVGSPAASGSIKLWTSSGTPFDAGFIDAAGAPAGSGNTILFTIGGGETRKFVSTASSALRQGFAIVTADAAVRGTAIFSQISGNTLFAEAGVPSADLVPRQSIFVDTTSGFSTGVAYANPNTSPAQITLQLFDAGGAPVGTPLAETLGANQHTSAFVSQKFAGAPPFTGTMQIRSNVPLAAIALRFASTGVFTTLPPVPLPGP
jgi:hypothetical protein